MITATSEPLLRQRSDYTYRFNLNSGRHGWLRLTPAYSVKIVEQIISRRKHVHKILDPFCGTGTTALCATSHGYDAVTTDINPFLIWLAQAKLSLYSKTDLANTRRMLPQIASLIHTQSIAPAPAPPIHNIERWWSAANIQYLSQLLAAIKLVATDFPLSQNLLLIAFCRTLMDLSNAAFNHQSMSFQNVNQLGLDLEVDSEEIFVGNVDVALSGAEINPSGKGKVIAGDARKVTLAEDGPFDLVVTSPPYANRMSYIRELRPYMYWLGFLSNGRDAGELDWSAIGGTWGVATSRLSDWKRSGKIFEYPQLDETLKEISHAKNKHGTVLANYVTKYFDDIWEHLQSLPPVLSPNAEVHYVVGNSTFYGSLISTEKIYADMLTKLGFRNVKCEAIRKRNSKKELVEFDVTGIWKG